MEYKLKSGAVITGTVEQIREIAKSLGETPKLEKLYFSSSKGEYLEISKMEDGHIRNALLKRSKEYFEALGTKKKLSNADFLQDFTQLGEDVIVVDLFTELSTRK